MSTIEIKVPDIGDFTDIPVIEVLVKPGDTVKEEDSLVTLESDKATMDVPSPVDGVVKELKVKVGDKVSEGSAASHRRGGRKGAAAPSTRNLHPRKRLRRALTPTLSRERERERRRRPA